nr:hypothetical protein [Tanacetum cinerariifolium]
AQQVSGGVFGQHALPVAAAHVFAGRHQHQILAAGGIKIHERVAEIVVEIVAQVAGRVEGAEAGLLVGRVAAQHFAARSLGVANKITGANCVNRMVLLGAVVPDVAQVVDVRRVGRRVVVRHHVAHARPAVAQRVDGVVGALGRRGA